MEPTDWSRSVEGDGNEGTETLAHVQMGFTSGFRL
jgi:hypothetical protein